GTTGRRVVEEARRLGLPIRLGGRSRSSLEELARTFDAEIRVAELDDPDALDDALEGAAAVLHCVGPFFKTARPVIEACLRQGVHYLDIDGELDTLERTLALGPQAEAAKIAIVPGVGWDVVPTDCLAARLSRAMPDATHLELGFARDDWVFSAGSFKTAVELLPRRGAVRRNGEIVTTPIADELCRIDLGDEVKWAMTLPWGDVSTAYHTTGIPNVKVFYCAPVIRYFILRSLDPWLPFYAAPGVRELTRAWADLVAPSRDLQERPDSRTRLWGSVRNAAGRSLVGFGETPSIYATTATAAVESARRLLEEGVAPGAWTPSRAFGPDLAEALPGVTMGPIVPGTVPRVG
ncbi:MAG: saccharopine dehydrogenase NADP-binding domain-containing protein, partial [Thermoanaerobaculia bacterium]|nr:saccharopine dehydrogenase NADP-binding domain-containing protein [Thermoanaerobaculia bacterium]